MINMKRKWVYRRSAYELRMDVLRALIEGHKIKSRIANITRISSSITPMLNAMHDGKLLTVSIEGRRDVYFITDKGRETVKSYNENRVAVGLPF